MPHSLADIVTFAPVSSICAVLLLAVLLIGYQSLSKNSQQLPLPPGPRPLPIIGNINDLPPAGSREWEHWLKHKDLYGPISSVTALGSTIVVINDAEVAVELLEKRSATHSSRPRLVFAGEMCGQERFLAVLPYNGRMRSIRKQMHAILGTKGTLGRLNSLQEVEVKRFLFRLLRKPEDLIQHIRTEAGAIILKVTYDYTIETEGLDPLVEVAERGVHEFSEATVPGRWLPNIVPALRYLPDWLPGTNFKQVGREWKAHFSELKDWPFRFVKHEIANHRHQPSFVSRLTEAAGPSATVEDEELIKDGAVSLFAGGADTIQKKAQEEIDRVVGAGRPPTFEDRDRLPYVNAVLQETFRWHPIAPLGVAHAASTDDVYRGYRIPKGAILLPNIWWFTHDPAVYSDPMSFNPGRFLGEHPERDPQDFIFGFGRRICPGRLLADSSVWLTIAKSLAVFNISKALDEEGRDIEPVIQFTGGIISRPVSLQVRIAPRSVKHEALIKEVEVKHPWEKSSAETLLKLRE